MNTIRWQKPKWLPRFLAMPVPEPAEQASRILSIQRNIILPARVIVTLIVFYYLFFYLVPDSEAWRLVLETLQRSFIFYIVFTSIAAVLLILRRFPPRLVQWVVFAVGLVDGILLAGLTLQTSGFESTLFWVFPGLIVVNALSIPLATPQIVLNLFLSAFYLTAGLLYITVEGSPGTPYTTSPLRNYLGAGRFSAGDIIDLKSFADKLKHPDPNDGVSQFLDGRLSPDTLRLLSNYTGGTNAALVQSLVDDLNHVIQGGSIYDPNRFAHVKISADSSKLLEEKTREADRMKLNRRLLQDAYPHEILKRKLWMNSEEMRNFIAPAGENVVMENDTELILLRLVILWLLTAACYGVQLLLFRQRVSEEEERKSAARNDELKAAGRLAAEIAHQMKNPLGIINNAIFSLQRGLREGKRDFDLQIQIIREEIERSDRILTQLMGYAQLSEGRVEKLLVPEELDRAINEVLPQGAYATQVTRDYGANLPTLLMQRNHLSVVLVNLLQNAREAMNGKGSIRVSAHYGDSNTLQIVIQDDGPGIPFEKLDKIFEAYVTTKDKGTGLGLAIVKHNVELYGGAVRAESEPGKGARFILLFPSKTFIVTNS